MSRTLKRLLPWILSLAIVGYLFWTVDREAFVDALREADMLAALGWIGLFTVGVFFLDTFTLRLLLVRLVTPMGYREVLAVKGVSYFLNAITYTAGAGGIAYFVHRKKKVPLLRALSSLVWLNFVDVMALLILLTGGLLFARDRLPDPALTQQISWVVGVGVVVALGALVYWRFGVDFLLLAPFRSWRIFQCFRDATWADYGVLIAARTGFIAMYIVMAWVLLPTFHIQVDAGGLVVYVPLLTFVQTIPASVSGLGAVQGVMQVVYGPYVDTSVITSAGLPLDPDAAVLAFSTVVGPVTALMRIGMGYFFMNDVTRDLMGEMNQALTEEEPMGEADSEDAAPTPPVRGPEGGGAEEPSATTRKPRRREASSLSLLQPLVCDLNRPLQIGGRRISAPRRSAHRTRRSLRRSPPLRRLRRRWGPDES